MKKKKNKVKKHKHEWIDDYSDCPICGGGVYWICECGEIKLKK